VLTQKFSGVTTSIALKVIGSGTTEIPSRSQNLPAVCQRLDFYNNSDTLLPMNEESEQLFEDFVEKHADSRVIAISHHIQFLIDDILKLELTEAKADLRQHMKSFEFCNQVIPHAHWVVQDAEKMLRGEPNFLAQSIQNYQNALKEASKDSDKSELRCEARWKDEKSDIAKRLGYPGLEPWCAADKVMEELNLLRQQNKPRPTGLRGEEIMRKVMAANGCNL
jgi:hypothetical protein